MFYKSILLLLQSLQENNLSPEKLQMVLNNYVLTIDSYLNLINREEEEVIYMSLREINASIEGFIHLLNYVEHITKGDQGSAGK